MLIHLYENMSPLICGDLGFWATLPDFLEENAQGDPEVPHNPARRPKKKGVSIPGSLGDLVFFV